MTDEHNLAEALAACREEQVLAIIRQKIDAGVPPKEIVAECNRGMVELGNRFQREECFLPDLMFGGAIMKNVLAELGPMLGEAAAAQAAGTVVIGSVQHDHHDIGKDIVVMMLRGVGFEVIDLGVDVPPERFVEAVRAHKPQVVGMSILLTTCYKSVAATTEAIRRAGLREGVGIMVGGAAAGELLKENAGCDFYGRTAVDGVDFAAARVGLN
jgi:5-methyltetrahydrofolate--homocysteine methyltransferase